MSQEETNAAQAAYQRIKSYEANTKKRYWGYFSGAFWTFQACLMVFIKPSFIGCFFLAFWLMFLCFFIYSSVNEKIVYRRDTCLLERLNGAFEPDANFDSKDDSERQTPETERKIFTLRGFVGFGVIMGTIFGIQYFIHHVLPVIIRYYYK